MENNLTENTTTQKNGLSSSQPLPPGRFTYYNKDQLLLSGLGQLHGPHFPPLPVPPMLMMDEISHIDPQGGKNKSGLLKARLQINPDLWFFACHFKQDPVMPGCLGLDALWQLLGFYLGWLGAEGKGRALGAKNIRFSGQVLPENKEVIYQIEVTRIRTSPLYLGVADGILICDGQILYEVEGLKVGIMPLTDPTKTTDTKQ